MCNRLPDVPVRVAFALACCVTMIPSLQAQTPPKSAEELMRQWDLDRDGTIDAAEAEMARTRMRRARTEAMMQSDVDPVTGRPRAATDAKAGRGREPGRTADVVPAASAGGDGGLILVPGNGEESPFAGPSPTAPPPAQPRRERDPLPGTSVPATKVPVQSVAPPSTAPGGSGGRAGPPSPAAGGRSQAAGDLSSRARVLPNGALAPPLPQTATQPGIIAGGARPANPAGRSTAAAPSQSRNSQSLNAGRLPAGLPQTRGVVPGGGSSVIAPVPRAPGQPLGTSPPGAIRGGTIRGGSQPLVPQTGAMPSGSVPLRGMVPPTGSTLPNRSGMRSPVAQPSGRTQPTGAPAVPRPPRVGPDDFYGR